MSGGTSLGTLLVQRLDAVLGHAAASHPHMVTGVRKDAVTGPGAAPRTPATEDTGRKPTPAEEAATLLKPQGTTQARLGPTGRVPLPHTGHPVSLDSTESTEPADSTEAVDERGQPKQVIRGRDVRPTATADSPRPPPLAAGSPSAPTVLGQTARLINSLLIDSALDGQTLRGQQPLMDAGTAKAPAQLATHLKQVVENSGLFYERHLGELAFGRRDLQQLRAEPQARWTSAHTVAHGSAQAPVSTDEPAAPSSQTGPLASAPRAEPPAAPAQTGTPAPATPPLSQDALMRLQLEALATQELRWRGEAWTDVPMDWRISGDETAPEQNDARAWRSALSLQLPRLGIIEIELSGAGNRVSMRMRSSEAATELDEHKKALQTRLLSQGLSADVVVANAGETGVGSDIAPDTASESI